MIRLSKSGCNIVCDIKDGLQVKRAVGYFNKRVSLCGVGHNPCVRVTGNVEHLTDSTLVHIVTITQILGKNDERFVADVFVRLTGEVAELCVSRMRNMRRESVVVKYFTLGRPSEFKQVLNSAGVSLGF